jgi:Clostripain family
MADYKCPKDKYSEWLIMVYLAGDNNLSPQSISYLQELEDATHNKNVRVIAGFDPSVPLPKGARYVEIKRHLDPAHPYHKMDWPLHNDLLPPGHVVVMPDFCETQPRPTNPYEPVAKEAFARFLDWARTCYEAKKYMLILFGHGPLVAGNTFLSDSTPPSYLKLTDFAKILNDHFGRKIHILGCDNCVMNGIETAVQLYGKVDYMIGSQGLMLINGWPFRKIIQEVGDYYRRDPAFVAERVLRVCAKSLLDFTLMERSSDQAICDVNKFGPRSNLVKRVKQLSVALQEGLSVYPKGGDYEGELRYPLVRDVVRLARIEAQAYWAETFVDLYDFCELLLLRCNDALCNLQSLIHKVFFRSLPEDKRGPIDVKKALLDWPPIKVLDAIAMACKNIMDTFQDEEVVTRSYYVCPQLQYSHGVSIYFPWTLPEGPITFEENPSGPPTIKWPFQEYQTYDFNQYGDWANALKTFFKATLRNVRRVEYDYEVDHILFFRRAISRRPGRAEFSTPAIDLLKSGQSSGEDDEFDFLRVKNYPRRFYLSPKDCTRMLPVMGPGTTRLATANNVMADPGKVNYLGWNIRGFMAEVIGLDPGKPFAEEEPSCPELQR